MSSRRNLTVMLAALAIVVGLLPAFVVAAARPTISLQVRVTNQVGRPLANRSVVVSTMWSSKADWQQHRRAVGRKAITDALGIASIPIALTDVERAAAHRNDDWVNLTVVTLDENGNPEAFASSSRYLGSKPAQQAQRSDLAAPGPDRPYGIPARAVCGSARVPCILHVLLGGVLLSGPVRPGRRVACGLRLRGRDVHLW